MLTDRLYEEVKEIWDSYYTNPFVKGIGTGDLSIDLFRNYMIQDYIYLLDYAKLFALGVVKAKDESTMRFFSQLVHSTLNGEMNLHKSYMKRLAITEEEIMAKKPTLANTSYTSYMLWVASNQGILELTVAVLACAWSYEMIGKELAKNLPSLQHEFYGEWIATYSSADYAKVNDTLLALVNHLGEDCSENEYANLKEIFLTCSKYEADFWDMSYKEGI